MKMASQDRETQMQNPMLVLDALYCEEEDLGECDLDEGSESVMGPLISSENYFDCEDNELVRLISKEKETYLGQIGLIADGSLMVARREAVDWMLRVVGHYGFTVVTSVLAVNYFDGFVSSLQFQRDKPWMSQLAAVACLSLAAKVEETQVPLLLDLQVEESNYVFEAKTIQRMELLVLSTLEWKMNPITPLSFVDYVLRRLRLKTPLQLEFLRRCERLLLSVITDSSFVCYLPSVLAAAIMLHVIKEIGPYNALDCQNELLDVLKMSRDKVDDCYKLIVELPRNHHKRRYRSIPNSPDGVIDAYLSCDSSNDSWAVASRISSSPEPMFKKSRVHEQQMRLAPLRHMCVGVVGSPH
ncbi:similar to CYCLIN D3;3 [Actinidia rufa]|uniref:Similar to CYCLIN D33 n=1 Tax=Actinidia rufa TaxID=165716 RepID=A0A7J0H6N6_9ERIC|nr:similar to CYCLIN D3;3 [Actinidia rufa]